MNNHYYIADVTKHNDYSPFGMLLPNRHGSSNEYRYGFQGQEKDDEIKGEGNSLNYKYRMHDSRVGRFFAVDPLTASYPYYTPYSFSGNKVIAYKELEGLEETPATFDQSALDRAKTGSYYNKQKNQNYRNYPEGTPLGVQFVDWSPIGYSSMVIYPNRNPTFYWNSQADYMGTGRQGGAGFIQHGQWTQTVLTNRVANNVGGQGNQIMINQRVIGTVNSPFVRGSGNPTGNFIAAVNDALGALRNPLPQVQVNVGGVVNVADNTTDPATTNNGMTITTVNTKVTTQTTNTLTPNNNVVMISFNTTLTNTEWGRNVLQQRFNAMMNQMGNPANVVYNPAANGWRMTVAQMGGNVNQAVISTGVQATPTTNTTTTTITTTTTDQFNTMRNGTTGNE